MSYELRTPVTCIRGVISLLLHKNNGHLSEEDQKLLHIAQSNSERLTSLITKTLDLERIRSGKMIYNFQSVNLKQLIKEAVKLNAFFAVQYNKKIVCNNLIDAYVFADSDFLIQVITNLLTNAAKFSFDNETIVINMRKNKKHVTVEVKNRGPGIAENLRDNIFERFFQADSSTSRSGEGAGLGLAISKAIIEQHKGTLTFRSIVNEETVFFFKLPLAIMNSSN